MVTPTPHSHWDKPWPAQTPVPQRPESSTPRRRRTPLVDRRKLLSSQRRQGQGTSVPDQDAIGSYPPSFSPFLPLILTTASPSPGSRISLSFASDPCTHLASPLPQSKQKVTVKYIPETTFSRVTQRPTPQFTRTNGPPSSVRVLSHLSSPLLVLINSQGIAAFLSTLRQTP